MSIWYDLEVTAIAENKTAVAKFFNLDDSWEDVRTDHFTFSFGGKNAPSLTLHKIMEKNPDLIFLINQSVECNTSQWFLMRFDQVSGKQQLVFVQDSGDCNNEINKRILEEYTKENPTLPEKHFANQKGFEGFRWKMFFNDFKKCAAILNNAENYKVMLATLGDREREAEQEAEQEAAFDSHDDSPFPDKADYE